MNEIGAITAAVERSRATLHDLDEANQLMDVNDRLDQIQTLMRIQTDLLIAFVTSFAAIQGQVIE